MTHAGYASLHSLNEWRSVWTLYHLSFLSYVSYLSGIVPAILCLIVCWCTELIQCIYCMSRSTPHAGHAGWRHYSILLLIPYRTEMDCLDITFIFPLSGLIHFFGQKKCCTCIHPLYETSHRLHGSCACHIFFLYSRHPFSYNTWIYALEKKSWLYFVRMQRHFSTSTETIVTVIQVILIQCDKSDTPHIALPSNVLKWTISNY